MSRGEKRMVPPADFTSYYGRNIVKPAPWKLEIPTYLFLGGLAAGSGMLAAGAQFTGRPELQTTTRVTAFGAVVGSTAVLVHDLGKPKRFVNMLRVVKLTSPMSVGTWILTGFSTCLATAMSADVAGRLLTGRAVLSNSATTSARRAPVIGVPTVARGSESAPVSSLIRLLARVDQLAGFGAAAFGPPLAAYTAVLLADTATPTWQAVYRELPFVFVSSALAASGGMAMVTTSVVQAGPARRLAVLGGCGDLAAFALLERNLSVGPNRIVAEPLHQGRAGILLKSAKVLTALGVVGTALGGRHRRVAALSGLALLAGSACTRFGIVDAGIASARDPKYTVVPQRERRQRRDQDHP